ncbi:MAG: Asp-tRNA(Asn)/Glu-tRNA(Gln) amidotransferase subunit GatC [Gemmatimonadota bacterium]|nr:Asp-tRNA(Asn)/Glu-tRNA(Gln) amidotransferase subunit GatC [Gemmatimonadota bacterium]
MKIERKKIEQIATLARLRLGDEEIDTMVKDLESILEHVEALSAAETEDVLPVVGASEHPAPMRADEPGADPLRRPLSEVAPSFNEGFFTVPRLAALDADALPGGGAA